MLSAPLAHRLLQGAVARRSKWRWFVDEVLQVRPGHRVLDVGCGTGELVQYLPEGVEYLGFDPNEAYLRVARRLHGRRARFATASIESFPWADAGELDLVVAVGTLHHVDDDTTDLALSRAASRLAPGGRFVAVDPTHVPDQHPVARWLALHDRGRHVREPETMERLVATHFEQVRVTTHHDFVRIPYTHLLVVATAR